MQTQHGVLYVVATPIGNLADLGERARMVLQQVSLILAEDTRHSQKLLNHHAIRTPLLSLHEHNEQQRTEELITRIASGESMALISDAGTPLISDPGYRLVNAAHAAAITVQAIPGPSAMIAALSVAGQPTDRFAFEGYLPSKQGARRRRLRELTAEPRTLVFFESPHRLDVMLADCVAALGADRPATLCKELTKQYERNFRGTLADLRDWLAADAKHGQGEFVIVVAGQAGETQQEDDPRPLLQSLLYHDVPVKTAAAIAADVTGQPRNKLYKLALALKNVAGGDAPTAD